MNTSRCKFIVGSVTHFDEEHRQIKMYPVAGGSEENRKFWEYTPSGLLDLSISNPNALKGITPGQEFYIDLTPVEN